MDSSFEPQSQNFIAHQRCKKHGYHEKELVDGYSTSNGDKTNTVRVGTMPGKQVTIYNKPKEITSNSKEYWWEIYHPQNLFYSQQ